MDVVNKGNYDHLKWVVNREYQHVKRLDELETLKVIYAESEKRGQMLINNSRDAISYIHEGMHVHANEAYLELFGFGSLDDIQGAPIMDLVNPEDQKAFKKFLRSQSDDGKSEQNMLDTHLAHTSGSSFSATMEFSRTTLDGEFCIQLIIRDRSNAKELEQQLNLLSQTDQLTGLYNRQHLIQLLQEQCNQAAARKTQSSLLQIQLENVESTKSTLGVMATDKMIVAVAHVLRNTVQDTDILCRFEGATYTVLSTLSSKKNITLYAGKILKIIDKFIYQVGNNSISPVCSIGIALIDESTSTANEALSRAERALEKALDKGQSLHIYTPEPGEKTQKQIDQLWMKRLSEALKSNRFLLRYQPIVSLGGDEYVRYEISYCVLDENSKPILHTEFSDAASRTGMTRSIDRWVIMSATKQLEETIKQAPNTVFFIPLSEDTLEDPELFRWFRQRLESLDLPRDCIVFQMSESSVITHLNQARAVSAALHNIHCKISLDNFGVEPNPFQLIKHVSADYVKINLEFIKDLWNDQPGKPANHSIACRKSTAQWANQYRPWCRRCR